MAPRRIAAWVVGALLASSALSGCFRAAYVDDPTPRRVATPVTYTTTAPQCPADTVLLGDDDRASGAGSVPTDFEARILLWCFVDYSTMQAVQKAERFSVTEVRRAATTELLRTLYLPDRRGRTGCAGALSGTVAVYLADGERRLVRVDLPQDPCSIRPEVAAELPDLDTPPTRTFTVDRPRRAR